MAFFSKSEDQAGQVDKSRLPRHIAIIMDGNGRWAKKRGLPRTAGHKVGAETFRKVAIRNIRRDAMDFVKKQQKDGEMTEDDAKAAEKDLQKLTDDKCKEVDAVLEKKEKELMSV